MTNMRFFTPEWRDGDLSDDEFERTPVLYEKRLAEIRGLLPAKVVQMLTTLSLHDAEVQVGELTDDYFRCLLRAGDLQRGYVDVVLTYRGVISLEGLPTVQDVLSADAEIVRDEIDFNDRQKTVEHRLLFAPSGELLVRFRDLEFSVESVPRRQFERSNPAFTDRRVRR